MLSNLKVKGTVYRYFRNVDNSYYKDEDNCDQNGYLWIEKVKIEKIDTVEVFSGRYDFKKGETGLITLKESVSVINSKSNRSDIRTAINNLRLNLEENKNLISEINKNYKYSEEYKKEEINKVLLDNLETENLITQFDSYLNSKDVKKEINRLRKISRELKSELKAYFNDVWKYNTKYISIVESNFIKRYPDFNIDFENKTYIDKNSLLKVVKL